MAVNSEMVADNLCVVSKNFLSVFKGRKKGSTDPREKMLRNVSKHLKGVPEKAIRDAIEFLSGEGHIYSTIDDDHFKATDG